MEYRLDELFHAKRVVFNVPLRKLTTFRIGGNAEAVISPMCVDDVLEFLKIVNDNEIPYFVMGNGSNILACDRGYKGVILRFDRFMSQIAFDENDKVTAMSGTKLNMIFDFSRYYNLGGAEFMQYIPATLGGAIVNNAGCFGYQMADIVDRVLVTDGKETRYMDKSEMMLTYRDSLFKKERKWIILKAELNFRGQFNSQLANDIASQKKYTQPLLSWSAGSVFKRKGDIMPARLIDELGLKGLTVGGAQISRVHSGFIVNASHHATCEDVMGLIEIIRNEIFRAYKIVPELEIELLGDC